VTKISIVNQSTLFKDADLPALANAVSLAMKRDWVPIWGIDAEIFYTPSGAHPSADHWVLALLDNADQAGALGYHDVTPTGQPLGKAFVATTLADGSSITVTLTHEFWEMLGDPDINLTAEFDDASGNPAKFYAYEVSDAVEADALGYQVVIPAGWAGAGTSILVSDFVTPAWFESFNKVGPFSFGKHVSAAFELAPGGYIGFLDLANLAQGWQQQTARTTGPTERMRQRPYEGSRRSRRAIPRKDWVRSTYAPGAEAIIAEVSKDFKGQ
jgi:hypothetical protein